MAKRIVEIVLKVTGKKNVKDLKSSLKGVGNAVSATAKALVAGAVAVTAFVVTLAKSRKEMALLAKQTKLNVKDFEALAFATKTYGLEAEQISDISKDLADKLGEFATVGTGAFQDFADVVGLSKIEARELAKEWENLSSDQVIGEMVKRMEDAGKTGNQMTFVLESMGSDLSLLLPLFKDNSKELDGLTGKYKKLTSELNLTEGEIEDLTEAGKSFAQLGIIAEKSAEKIAGSIAPAIKDLVDFLVEEIPQLTVDLIEFFEGPQVAQTQTVAQRIAEIQESLANLKDEYIALKSGSVVTDFVKKIFISDEEVEAEQRRLDDIIRIKKGLEAELAGLALLDSDVLVADRRPSVEIPDVKADDIGGGEGGLAIPKEEADALAVRAVLLEQEIDLIKRAETEKSLVREGFRTAEESALNLSLVAEFNAIENEQNELIALYGKEVAEELELFQLLNDKKTELDEQGSRSRIQIAEDESKRKAEALIKGASTYLNQLQQLSPKSDGLKKASIVGSTAVAVMESFKNGGGYPWGLIPAGIMAGIGLKQLAQVGKKTASSGLGGGASGGAPLSAGINSPSFTQDTQVNNIQSTELLALRNELASLDPDEVLPVAFTRRLAMSLDSATNEGTI